MTENQNSAVISTSERGEISSPVKIASTVGMTMLFKIQQSSNKK